MVMGTGSETLQLVEGLGGVHPLCLLPFIRICTDANYFELNLQKVIVLKTQVCPTVLLEILDLESNISVPLLGQPAYIRKVLSRRHADVDRRH